VIFQILSIIYDPPDGEFATAQGNTAKWMISAMIFGNLLMSQIEIKSSYSSVVLVLLLS